MKTHTIKICTAVLSAILFLGGFHAEAMGFANGTEKQKTDQAKKKEKKERKISLWGHVKNSFTKVGIPDTKITLMLEDSTIVDTMTVNKPGKNAGIKYDSFYRFKIPAKKQKYIILAQHPDYEDCYVNFEVKHIARNTYMDAPWHYMKRKDPNADLSQMLDEVKVTATKVRIAYKGDTIIFNADAFNVPEGSMLDGLIRQLPGVELKENGEILVNGRKIDYLTLNGKDFFKGDNKIMLDNLPYYSVESVSAFEKSTDRSEFLGRDTEKKEYVMDVQLKREYSKGYMANATLGGGTDQRYLGRIFGMRYTDNSRLVIFGTANNINETRSPGNDGEWSPSNQTTGNIDVISGGISLMIDDKDKRYTENADFVASTQKNDIRSYEASESLLSSGSSFSRNRNKTSIDMLNIGLDNKFVLKKPVLLSQTTHIGYTQNNRESWGQSVTFSSDPSGFGNTMQVLDSMFASLSDPLRAISTNSTSSAYATRNYNFELNTNTYFSTKFKTGDDLWIRYKFNLYNYSNRSFDRTMYKYYNIDDLSDGRNRHTTDPMKDFDYEIKAEYTLHWLNNWNLAINGGYTYRYSERTYTNYRLDRLPGWGYDTMHEIGELPSSRDSLLLSIDAENCYNYHTHNKNLYFGVRPYYSHSWDDKELWLNIDTWITMLESDIYYHAIQGSEHANRKNTFITNMSDITYSTHNHKRQYRFSFSSVRSAPWMFNLINRSSSTNPLAVYEGNPNLKNSASHNMSLSYTQHLPERSQTFSIGASGGINENMVAQGYNYDPSTGIYTYKPVNVNGNWYSGIYVSFNRCIDKLKLWSWSTNTSMNYNRYVDLTSQSGETSSTKNTTGSYYTSETLKLTYQKNDLSIGLNGRLTWRRSLVSNKNANDVNAADFSYGLTFRYTLPWKIELATDIKMFSRRGYSESNMNTNDLIWNAQLTRSFCKGNLVAALTGFDILGQLSSTYYNINSQGFSEYWVNSLNRYVMLSLRYKFNLAPGK